MSTQIKVSRSVIIEVPYDNIHDAFDCARNKYMNGDDGAQLDETVFEKVCYVPRGDHIDSAVQTIQSEIQSICNRIPSNLPVEDAQEWLRDAMIDVIYNNT